VPFWILQLAELLAAVALADLSLHVNRGGLLVAGTAVFALLAITAKGPLGLVRLVPRRLHVYAVCVVAVVFALAPIIPQIRPDASGIIIIVFGAVGLFRLATMTRTDLPVRAPRGLARPWVRPSAGDTQSGAGAGPGSASPGSASPGSASPGSASPGAQGLGSAARSAVSPGSASPSAVSPGSASDGLSTTEIAARLLGRGAKTAAHHAGTAVEAAALTAEKHGPAAKAQASRAVRSAGRLTGRLTRSAGSGSSPRSTPGSSGASAAPGSPGSAEVSAASAAPGSPGSAGSSGGSSGAGEPPETAEVQGPEDPKQAAES
jgi:hypothetical protein